MKTRAILILAFAASAAIGNAHAASTDSAKKNKRSDCLFANQPQSWRVLDQQQLVIWGPSRKDAYLVKLFSPLQDLNFAETLAFIDDDHDGMICGNGGDKIGVPGSKISSFPATIASMRKVDDAELVALGEQYKMKLVSDKKAQEIKSHDKQIHGE